MRNQSLKIKLLEIFGIVAVVFFLAVSGVASPESKGGARPDIPGRTPAPLDIDKVLSIENIRPKGLSYKAMVPDTLDLADRARYAINALIGNMDPEQYYGVYQVIYFDKTPPKKDALTWNITPKNVRTLPLMRTMSGSDDRLEADLGAMRALMKEVRADGNMYYPFDGSGPPKGTTYPQTNANLMQAIRNWQGRDGNPAWNDWIRLLASGLRRDAIRVEERAYYPMQSGIDPDGKWHFMNHEGDIPVPYTPPDEPISDQQGLEGAAKSDQNRPMSGLIKDYTLTGNKESLDLAQRLSRFILKPGMWEDTRPLGYPGNEHGIWAGHGYNGPQSLMALLDLAIADNNPWLKQFVREGYDNAVRNGNVRVGFFSAWVQPEKFNRPAWLHGVTESCGVAAIMDLAVKLSDAGIGDYWDDVDSIIRNQLATQQMFKLDLLQRMAGTGAETEKVLKSTMGGFGNAEPTRVPRNLSYMAGCCTANGSQALYYAWHGITRFENGVATVNLFLNRASAWMDVDSYLPYEGKVVLHNKQARTALVRIPVWVDTAQVKAFVNEKAVHPPIAGRRLVIDGLKPGDDIRLEFPVHETVDSYTIDGKLYKITFRGSTVVDINPNLSESNEYPLYQRAEMRKNKAPMKQVTRFVPERVVPLGPY